MRTKNKKVKSSYSILVKIQIIRLYLKIKEGMLGKSVPYVIYYVDEIKLTEIQ